MSGSIESVLPGHIRKVFEQYGVIKPAGWPKLDHLVKQITTRKFRYDIETDQMGVVTARVFAQGNTYTAVDGEPERALAKAFHECLAEVGSSQLGMFEDDDEEDEDEPDPDPARYMKAAVGAMQRQADRDGLTTTFTAGGRSATIAPRNQNPSGETFHVDDLGRYVSDDSGEILDPTDVPLASTGGR